MTIFRFERAMRNQQQKLDLTLTGKENRLRLESRILLENSVLSCQAMPKASNKDIFDNGLAFGGNLLTLKTPRTTQQWNGLLVIYDGAKCIAMDSLPLGTIAACSEQRQRQRLSTIQWSLT
jgi:hypothetical protein